MAKLVRSTACAAVAASLLMGAFPASAMPAFDAERMQDAPYAPESARHRRDYDDDWRDQDRYRERDGYRYRSYYGRRDGYDERIRRDTPIWRGRDGRYYCRKEDGTTGLLIGGVVGGLVGNELAGGGDRTLGTILGVAGGALLGRAIDRSDSRCR